MADNVRRLGEEAGFPARIFLIKPHFKSKQNFQTENFLRFFAKPLLSAVAFACEVKQIQKITLKADGDVGVIFGAVADNVRRIWRVAAAAPDLRTKSGL